MCMALLVCEFMCMRPRIGALSLFTEARALSQTQSFPVWLVPLASWCWESQSRSFDTRLSGRPPYPTGTCVGSGDLNRVLTVA